MMETIGIYKITSPNKRVYIGQSINIKKRFQCYRRLNDNTKRQPLLYRSFVKYGVDKHKFEIVAECGINELNRMERYYQDLYKVCDSKGGLNCRLTESDDRSAVFSKETRERISAATTKLSIKQTSEILDLLHSGDSVIDISKKYNVDRGTVGKIKKGTYYNLDTEKFKKLEHSQLVETNIKHAKISFIRNNYGTMTIDDLSVILGLTRPTVIFYISSNNLKKCTPPKRWTEEETEFMIDNYKDYGDDMLSEIMNIKFNRTDKWCKKNIEKKRAILGVKRNKEQIYKLRSMSSKRNLYKNEMEKIKSGILPESLTKKQAA